MTQVTSNDTPSPLAIAVPSSPASTIAPAPGVEAIPGYILKEKIGAGGYGEVWSADAPGGLTKAIKFVFGSMNDARAIRELKSLNRVKEVHHPFLLSLERIEVVGGQLIILTELAESCLKRRFDECREEGLPGIPRDELLDYLRDTADALDYLYEKHTLQHLDVKPENLLLVGNRVKVADFGLLKDLRETSASLMGGMTPLYSPPEVFDGRPNQYSDQYSLSIVYQELLTGEPPFSGRTTAQLAAQHLSSPPMLSPLPLAEQPIIARSLAKDPQKRFPSCKALVEALRNPKNASVGPRKNLSVKAKPVEVAQQTQVIGEGPVQSCNHTQTLRTAPAEIKALQPLELTDRDLSFRPTVFVGLGGTGGKILGKIRHRLCDRYGNISDIPAFQLLNIDSDVKALHRLAVGDDGSEIPTRDTLGVPLRKAQDYREGKEHLLSWLSRRWLYNIPRSLQTEGMRPLGRLALVDHVRAVQQRLCQSIEQAMDKAGLEMSARRTGFEFASDTPRICVVSSLNGGFGSGAVIDLAYWIRSLLAERDISDSLLTGFLTHGTPRKTDERDLAIANAASCLDELQHFSAYGQSYPADPVCGMDGFEEDNATFRDAYVIHLGNELTNEEFDDSLNHVAEYLYRSAATNAAAFFDKARQLEHEELQNPLGERRVRSFGIYQFGAMQSDVSKSAVDKLCQEVAQTWSGGLSSSDVNRLMTSPGAHGRSTMERTNRATRNAELDLKLSSLAARANQIVDDFCEQELDKQLHEITLDALSRLNGPPGSRSDSKVFDRLDRLISGVRKTDGKGTTRYLKSELDDAMNSIVEKTIRVARENIFGLIDTPYERVPGAQRATQWLSEKIERLEQDNEQVRVRLLQELTFFQQRFRAQLGVMDPEAIEQSLQSRSVMIGHLDVLKYAKLQHVTSLHGSLRTVINKLSTFAKQLAQDVDNITNQLRSFTHHFAVVPSSEPRSVVDEIVRHDLDELVVELENELATKFFSANRTLSHVLSHGDSAIDDLVISMRTAARKVILARASTAASQDIVNQASNTDLIRKGLEEAMPVFAECGADYRLLVTAGNQELLDEIQESISCASNVAPTILPESDGDVTLCYELEGIPLSGIRRGLTGLRQEFGELAARLHTRKDIEWTSLCNGFEFHN